jgi:hypothetical protein
MNTAEQAFARLSAAKWAHGQWRTKRSAADELAADEQATAYADWYVVTYRAVSMADLPAHSVAWQRYLSEQQS